MCSSLGGEISVCVLRCLLVHRELTIGSVFKIPPHAVKLTLLSLSTSPATLSWHFDMRNLLILFFFLLRWGSVLFKGLSFPPPPPDCLNPASVWIVFQFQTKDRGGITISLPFTLFQVAAAEVFFFFLKPLPGCFSFFFLVCLFLLNLKHSISSERGPFLQVSRADFVVRANKVPSGLLSELLTSS